MPDNVVLPSRYATSNVIVVGSEEWKKLMSSVENTKQLEEEVKQLKQLQADVEERQRTEAEINNKNLARLIECEKEIVQVRLTLWKTRFVVLFEGLVIAGLIYLKLKF